MWRSILAIAAVIVFSSSAFAQSAPQDATSLFEQGRSLAADGNFLEACDSFAQSLALDPTAMGTQVNLADCLEHVGQQAKAWRLFLDAAAQSDKDGNSERACFARSRATALDAQLATVVISLGIANVTGARVTINGQEVTPAAEISERVNPGEITVVVTVAGHAPIVKTEQLAAGGTIRVDATGEVAPGQRASEPARRRSFVLAAVGLGAAGAAELVTSIGLGIAARRNYDAALGLPSDRVSLMAVTDAQHLADIATVLGVSGIVLASSAAALYYWAPREVMIAPTAGAGSVGLSAAGRF